VRVASLPGCVSQLLADSTINTLVRSSDGSENSVLTVLAQVIRKMVERFGTPADLEIWRRLSCIDSFQVELGVEMI